MFFYIVYFLTFFYSFLTLFVLNKNKDDLEKQSECWEKVRNSSMTLLDLVNDVPDMSKLESGEIVLKRVPFDLEEVSIDKSAHGENSSEKEAE